MAEPFFPPARLVTWLAALRAGQITAAPAEGVYGYCADPFNPAALQALIQLKQRNPAKGFILLVSNPYQLASVANLTYPQDASIHAAITRAIASYFPFDNSAQPPTTLILPAAANLNPALTGTNTASGYPTVAVRAPTTPYMLEYLQAFAGPLVSTSLNLSGQPPATQISQIPANIPALTLPEPLSGTPSRIFNPLTAEWLR
jgi:L-threonylcarbamoyladenylate synthase